MASRNRDVADGFERNGRAIYIDASDKATFSPSKWHHHRRLPPWEFHFTRVLRQGGTFVKRGSARLFSPTLSPRFRTNTLKAPPTLTATVASKKLARFSRTPPSPSARYQIRNPTRDNPSLTSGSEIFLLALLFSFLLTLSPGVNRDAPRYHPRLTVWEKKAQFPSLFFLSFVYMSIYHAIFPLAILWTCLLLAMFTFLQTSLLLPFSNYNPREDA